MSPHAALRRVLPMLRLTTAGVLRAILAGTVTLASALALSAVSAWLITRAWEMPPVLDLSIAVVTVRALGISRAAFRYLDRLVTHDVALRGVVELRTTVYERLAAAPTALVASLRRGDLLSRFSQDVEEIGNVVIRSVVPAGVALLMAVGSTVLLAVFSPAAGLAVGIALVIATVVSPVLAYRAARTHEEATLAHRADLTAATLTGVEDAAELQVAGLFEVQMGGLHAAQDRFDGAIDRAAGPSAVAGAIVPLMTGLATLCAVIAGAHDYLAGMLTVPEFGVVVLTPLAVFEAASALPQAASQYARSGAAAQRILAMIGEGAPVAQAAPGSATASPSPAGGALDLAGVATGWPGTGRTVSAGVTLRVQPGDRLALVGDSGQGKSTLLMTLAGLIPPIAGTARLGGTDLRDLEAATVRSYVVYASEDAHVFHTTLRENLHVARGDATDAEMVAMLGRVGLGPWLAEQDAGLDLMLASDAQTLSGGERRRVLLARALLSRAPILLLDEPTEHLEAAAGDRLLADLLDPASGLVPPEQAVVVVCHRIGGLAGCERIGLLARGTMQPVASFSHLLEHSQDFRSLIREESV